MHLNHAKNGSQNRFENNALTISEQSSIFLALLLIYSAMRTSEKKNKERQVFRRLVLDNAFTLLKTKGIDGITMRSVAEHTQNSQSKIYTFFSGKDQLLEVLCEELCQKLITLIETIGTSRDPAEDLCKMVVQTTDFHLAYPNSDALFTLIYYGGQRFKLPETFRKLEICYALALQRLDSPYLKTADEISDALDILRSIFIGVTTLMSSEISLAGKRRAQAIAENAIRVILRGWGK